MTSEVSLLPRTVGYIGAGTYTDIVAIDAPSSAAAGETVPVTIKIKNIWENILLIAADGAYDGAPFLHIEYWIPPGETHSFSGSFTMPSSGVTIHASSSYWLFGDIWELDDEAEKAVSLEEVVIGWQLLDSRTLAVALPPPVVGWQLLDSRTVAVKSKPPVVGWQLLDSRTVAVKSKPPVVGWQLLDSRTIPISSRPPVVGWQLLDEKTVSLTAGPPAEIWELIQHTIYHFAYIYDGDVEVNIATFKIDPFTPSAWAAKKFADTLESEARKKGARVLETKVYVDTTPLLWTDIRIEVTGTPLGGDGVAGRGIAVGIAPWLAIILVCLAIIAVIIVATLAFDHWMEKFKKKPGLEDVKPAWGKEALILDIQDAEEYWERTPTPVETLEGMSEEELRDHLDQIAEEEMPPEELVWPLVALAILGVGVGGALIAGYLLSKPE